MIILVVYESIEGHTEKIARKIANQVEAAHHQVILANLREPGAAIPGSHDATIVCGPIHVGKYPNALVRFVTDFKSALNTTTSALITVSLGIASEHAEERVAVQTLADDLVKSSGWTPTLRHDAAGALKYLEYNFFKRLTMRYIAGQSGGPVDTGSDYEFTDWGELEKFVVELLTKAAIAAPQLAH